MNFSNKVDWKTVYFVSLALCIATILNYAKLEGIFLNQHSYPEMWDQVSSYLGMYILFMLVMFGISALIEGTEEWVKYPWGWKKENAGIRFVSPLGVPLWMWAAYLLMLYMIMDIEPDWQTPIITVWFYVHIPGFVNWLVKVFVRNEKYAQG